MLSFFFEFLKQIIITLKVMISIVSINFAAMIRNFFLLIFLLSVLSCSFKLDKAGYMFENTDFSSIKKNVTSKNTILKNFGSPTAVMSLEDQEVWIYFSEEIKQILFFKPTVVWRKVVLLKFDEEDRVKFINNLDLNDNDNSFFVNINKTQLPQHESNFFNEIFGNIGTIRPQ